MTPKIYEYEQEFVWFLDQIASTETSLNMMKPGFTWRLKYKVVLSCFFLLFSVKCMIFIYIYMTLYLKKNPLFVI